MSQGPVNIGHVYMSELLKKGSNNVYSAMGPKNTLRTKVTATSFSKSSFFIEVKGLSPNVLMGPYIELCCPIDVRFTEHTRLAIPNGYMDLNGTTCVGYAGQSTANSPAAMPALQSVDSVCLRPNGVVRALRSCVMGLNGSSFSTVCSQWIDIVERLWSDGRVENCYGASCAQPPYSNIGHPDHPLKEKSRYERCRQTVGKAQVKDNGVHFNANNQIDDCIFTFVLRTRLFLGPWVFSQFPGMGEYLGENFSGAMPYVNSLTIEGQWHDNPLIHFFSQCSTDASDSLAFQSSYNGCRAALPPPLVSGQPGAAVTGIPSVWKVQAPPLADAGTHNIDFHRMWATAVVGELKHGDAAANAQLVGIRQPYLNVQWLEPDLSIQQMDPVYTFAGRRFTCYEDTQQIKGGIVPAAQQKTTTFNFQHIKIDKIAELYCIYVTDAYNDVGDYRGARQAKWSTGVGTVIGHKGASYTNLFAPISWGTVRISLSTKSQILGNLSSEALGLTEVSQYRKYMKYSARKNPMSFLEWRKHSQCILFSAEEVFLAFGGTFQRVTLNISFQAGRMCTDTQFSGRDTFQLGNAAGPYNAAGAVGKGGLANKDKGNDKNRNLTAHLVMIEPTQIQISQTGCTTQDVTFTNEEAKSVFLAQSQTGVISKDSMGLQGLANDA